MRILILFFSLVFLGGCLDSDSSRESDFKPSSSDTASVVLLLTDAALEDYDEVNLQLQRVTLLPDETADMADEVILYEGEQKINLLDLRHHAELFSLTDQVPVGDYSVLRLYSDQKVELVTYDEEGASETDTAILEYEYLDLLMEDPLVLAGGETTYLEVDIDLQMSLLSYDEATATLYFEPVVSARTLEDADEGSASDEASLQARQPFVSVRGLLREELLVCPSAQAATSACTQLVVDEAAQVYDLNGSLTTRDQLPVGAQVIVMGQLSSVSEAGQRLLETYVVAEGQRPQINIRSLRAVEVNAEEGITLANGRSAAWSEGARIITQEGQQASLDDLEVPLQATVLGRFEAGSLQAIALMLLQEGVDAEEPVSSQGSRSQVLHAEFDQVLDPVLGVYQVIYQGEPLRVEAAAARLVVTGSGRVASPDREEALTDQDQGAKVTLRGVFEEEAAEEAGKAILVAEHWVVHRSPAQRGILRGQSN